MKASRPFTEYLDKKLQEPGEAEAYLNAALDEGDDVFLLALNDVARAYGIAKVAEQTELARTNLYRMLSKGGNPRLSSLEAILDALGMRLRIESKDTAA